MRHLELFTTIAPPIDKCSPSEWLRCTSRMEPGPIPGLAVVDLFAGCGGMSLGALAAAHARDRAFRICLAADICETTIGVYRDNFGSYGERIEALDLACGAIGLSERAIERQRTALGEVGTPNLLLAGPPCQGHSDLNNRTRRSDPRNGLYLAAIRAVLALRPDAAVIENVPTVVHDESGVVTRSDVILRREGYSTQEFIFLASDAGVAQHRRRHVLVATSRGAFNIQDAIARFSAPTQTLRDAIGDLAGNTRDVLFDSPSAMTEANRRRVDWLFGNRAYELPNRYRPRCHRDGGHSYKSVYGRLRWDRPAPTITSGFGSMGQGRFVHPSKKRTLTPHEAARIQSFPDGFDFSGCSGRVALQQMIGNAVPPRMGACIVLGLIDQSLV